jgi:hypothetical protein
LIFSEALSVAEERDSILRAPKLLDQLEFAAPSTHSDAMMEDFISIRIRHRDKNRVLAKQAEISMVMTDAIFVSQASYTALIAAFGILCGSI